MRCLKNTQIEMSKQIAGHIDIKPTRICKLKTLFRRPLASSASRVILETMGLVSGLGSYREKRHKGCTLGKATETE